MTEEKKKYYPVPKTGAAALGGAVGTLVVAVITRRFGVDLTPEEIGAIVVITGYLTSWFTDE